MGSLPTLSKENTQTKLPVHILTGFLGSGKTTLLNRLLTETGLENTAVIVNEFGNVGIDHLLVEARTEDIMMLEGGCMCCTVRADLVETLEDLYHKREQGEIPAFSQVLVETTGLADPAPILRTLMDDDFIAEHYRLDAVVTTVDAVHAAGQLSEHDESVKQAALAHHLVITKTDIAASEAVEKLRARLHKINPSAKLYDVQQDALQAKVLLDSGAYHPDGLDVEQWLQSTRYTALSQQAPIVFKPKPHNEHHHEHEHEHTSHEEHHHEHVHTPHDAHIRTFCLEYFEPLSWKVLEHWIAQLRRLRGKDLLRVKGVVFTKETDLPVVMQGVQHIFQPPATLETWPWNPPSTKIVFITRNIDQAVVEKNLHALIKSNSAPEVCEAALLLL